MLEFEDNITDNHLSQNIDIFSFDSINETNQIEQESFPIIPFNKNLFPAKNTYEFSKEILPFQNEFNFEDKKEKEKKILFINKKDFKNSKGRKTNRDKSNINYKYRYIHDKFGTDNLLRKIQVHYLSFIVDFSNSVLLKFQYDEFFVKIDYKLKRKVNKDYISFLKGLNISEILCWDISPKFRKITKENNKNLYNKVIENPVIKQIFEEKYLSLFRDIYFKNKRIINLSKYGLNDNIKLSEKKVKMYNELLEKIEKEEKGIDIDKKEYIDKLQNCIKKIYLSTSQ